MGFNINELVQTRGWKLFMAKVYGWGAAVVLIGAMFKIMHWPGAGPMLVVGLGVEAFIFFSSAFEPLHEEYDWALVYPELGGMDEDLVETTPVHKPSSKQSALEKFDELLNNAQISPELFEKLGEGLRNLNVTTEKLSDVSGATAATNNYVANFEKASQKVNEFADIYGQSAQVLNTSASSLSNSYQKTTDVLSNSTEQFANTISNVGNQMAETLIKAGQESSQNFTSSFKKVSDQIVNAGQEIATSYTQITETLNNDFSSITQGSKTYSDQLMLITKNLTALNAVYELQLQGSNEHMESAKQLFGGMEEIMVNMKESVEDVKRYKEEVSKLGQNLAAMNTIYGNMLTAMNFSK